MIVTDLAEAGLEDMDAMVERRRRQFQAVHGLSGRADGGRRDHLQGARASARNGALICMHAENGGVIDVIVRRALAEGKTAPIYHALTRPATAEAEPCIAPSPWRRWRERRLHRSPFVEDALNQVREARDRGLPAFAETCPQYLLLSMEELARPGFEGAKYVFTPPLREKHHQPKLWDGLKNDHLQVVSTDHCPFCFADQKQLGKDDFTKIPNGGPGIENRLQLIHHYGVNAGKTR